MTPEKIYALNTQSAVECLEHLLSVNMDTLQADRAVAFHYKMGGQWLWAEEPDMVEQASSVIDYLRQHVGDIGFKPEVFFLPQMEADIVRLDSLRFDSIDTMPVVMARLEYDLSRAFLRYVRGQRYGFMNPSPVFNHLDLRDERPGDYRRLFDIPVEQPDSLFFEHALGQVAEGRAVEFMQKCEPVDTVYILFNRLLITDSTADGRRRLLCNMERRRWRSDETLGRHQRFVFVNMPSQQVWAVAPDSVFSMRICLGAWKTKTPMLHSAISRIEINPEWVIPPSIIRNEISGHAGDSAYFARHRYFIINRHSGDTVDSRTISTEQLRSGGYRVAQRSGRGNSLGRIIFRFPNQHAVYLHDTNNHGAFQGERRTISHGCIRLQRPFDMATFLLPNADEWLLDRMRLSMDMKPVGEWGHNYLKKRAEEGDKSPIRLISSTAVEPSVPIYLTYYTCFPNPETGIIETWPDRYEYDRQIAKTLSLYFP